MVDSLELIDSISITSISISVLLYTLTTQCVHMSPQHTHIQTYGRRKRWIVSCIISFMHVRYESSSASTFHLHQGRDRWNTIVSSWCDEQSLSVDDCSSFKYICGVCVYFVPSMGASLLRTKQNGTTIPHNIDMGTNRLIWAIVVANARRPRIHFHQSIHKHV